MRIKIQEKDIEVRVQERRVVKADFIYQGKVIASGEAVCAPQDIYIPKEGQRIAVERAANILEGDQLADRKQDVEELVKLDHAPDFYLPEGRFPVLRSAKSITQEVMKKLEQRRAKEAVREATGRLSCSSPNVQGLPASGREVIDIFNQCFPTLADLFTTIKSPPIR